MNVEMSENTFNLLGQILTSDINVPVKLAAGYAQAQAEFQAHVEKTNAGQPVVVEEE